MTRIALPQNPASKTLTLTKSSLMASSSLLRRSLRQSLIGLRSYSSSSLVRKAIAQQNLTKNPSSLLSPRFASSSSPSKAEAARADEKLKRVLESEIECQETEGTPGQVAEVPEGFPFKITDNPGDQTITLKRKFAGENIHITVLMNDEDVEDEDDSGDGDNETSIQPNFSLVVSIDKGVDHVVEFCCNLNADELGIESLTMKSREDSENEYAYNGPEFMDLDESLQKALHKYLEERGIKHSLFEFMYAYMMNKDESEYLLWLKNLKEFVEN